MLYRQKISVAREVIVHDVQLDVIHTRFQHLLMHVEQRGVMGWAKVYNTRIAVTIH